MNHENQRRRQWKLGSQLVIIAKVNVDHQQLINSRSLAILEINCKRRIFMNEIRLIECFDNLRNLPPLIEVCSSRNKPRIAHRSEQFHLTFGQL